MHRSFLDGTYIKVSAGHGGSGSVSFAQSRGIKLGPDGGHGGAGGDVWLVATRNLNTLSKLSRGREYKADRGGDGSSQKKTGARGKSLEIEVPCGTEIYVAGNGAPFGTDKTTDKPMDRWIGALNHHNEKILVARGGTRGLGNIAFVSSTEQRPTATVPGGEGQSRTLVLKLKLLAHVGLAGYPNAGKSTLLRSLSRAKPKVAAYPFTTVHPHLGVMKTDPLSDEAALIVADIPGLLEGAAEGKGLGMEFLRHLEKTAVILLVIAAGTPEEIWRKQQVLEASLAAYSGELASKPKRLFISKSDSLSPEGRQELVRKFEKNKVPYLLGSAHTKEGIDELQHELLDVVKSLQPTESLQQPTTTENKDRGKQDRVSSLMVANRQSQGRIQSAMDYVTSLLSGEASVVIRDNQ